MHHQSTCPECGRVFSPSRDRVRHCSLRCAGIATSRRRPRQVERRHKTGYVLVYAPDHPKGPRVRRSLLVVEAALGRHLAPGEVVHHENGVKDDDRLENLRVMTAAAHMSLHKRGLVQKRGAHGRFTR